MKAEIQPTSDGFWRWVILQGPWRIAEGDVLYTRRRDAKRGLIRFLKGMKKGVEVPE